MKTTQIFEAEDGTTFPNAEECRAYEADAALRQLVGLTIEDIKAAVTYQNKSLAKVIEATARRVIAARIDAGDMSPRGRKKAGESAAAEGVEPTSEVGPAAETEPNAEATETAEPQDVGDVTPLRSRKKAA